MKVIPETYLMKVIPDLTPVTYLMKVIPDVPDEGYSRNVSST